MEIKKVVTQLKTFVSIAIKIEITHHENNGVEEISNIYYKAILNIKERIRVKQLESNGKGSFPEIYQCNNL